jgi:AcrR family transcriptional regulator
MEPLADLAPRKLPRQRRSRILVKRVIGVAAAILAEEGLEGLTTNRIAERAGVSVGSIYQYFPNKRAIMAVLVENLVEDIQAEVLATMRVVTPDLAPSSPREIIAPFVRGVLNRADIILALMPHIDELQRLGVIARPEDMIRRAARGALLASPVKLRQPNMDAALFVVVECLSHLVRRYLSGPPLGLDVDELITMMSDLAGRFLYEDPPAQSGKVR